MRKSTPILLFLSSVILMQSSSLISHGKTLPPPAPLPTVTDERVIHYNQGVNLANQGNIDSAIEELKTAVSVNPQLAPAYYNLGVLYARKEQWDKASEALKKAVALDMRQASYWAALGDSADHMGESETAVRCYNNALQLGAQSSWIYERLGKNYVKLHDWDHVRKVRDTLLSLRTPSAAKMAALLEDSIPAPPETPPPSPPVASVKPVARPVNASSKPNNPDSVTPQKKELDVDGLARHTVGGMTYYAKKDYRKAADEFEDALAIDPSQADIRLHLGSCYDNLGKISLAIEEWQKVTQTQTPLLTAKADAHYSLGVSYRELLVYDKALAHFKKAVVTDPRPGKRRNLIVRDSYFQMALIYKVRRQYADAQTVLNQALKIDPKFSDAQQLLLTLPSPSQGHR